MHPSCDIVQLRSQIKTDVTVLRISGLNSVRELCKHYNCKVQYDSASSYCYPSVTINIRQADVVSDSSYFVRIFCHELAHHIQYQLSERIDSFFAHKGFKNAVIFERAAERLAYFLSKEHFPLFRLHHSVFNAYRSQKDLDFLRRWKGLR